MTGIVCPCSWGIDTGIGMRTRQGWAHDRDGHTTGMGIGICTAVEIGIGRGIGIGTWIGTG